MPGSTDPASALSTVTSDARFIGLMSGTSMDGIDAALVAFGDHQCDTIATRSVQYPPDLREALLLASRNPGDCTVDKIGQLDNWVGHCFADAARQLLDQAKVSAMHVTAVGSHGQTLRHQPRAARPFTLQIGDPNIIAAGTGITTVADFRRRDLARGGEGAPLTPAFHRWLFLKPGKVRAVVNIGGIANATILRPAPDPVTGFDTGPGNTLLDAWSRMHLGKPYDDQGKWAQSGHVFEALLGHMLADQYFALKPPKSTGFEYFNDAWLRQMLDAGGAGGIAAADVQATIAELTARTIANSILTCAPDIEEILVCGGGVHNTDLMIRLQACFSGIEVTPTGSHGLHPDWVEAAAFAWLAKRCLEGKPGNLPEVTGASVADILGAIYQCTS